MATEQSFVDYVVDQMQDAGDIRSGKMFGEYGLWDNRKFFALICNNQLFIKPTEPGGEYIGEPTLAPPYPGAKDYFLIEEKLEDRDWLCGLVLTTTAALPEPKPKRKKKSK